MAEIALNDEDNQQDMARALLGMADDPGQVTWTPRPNTPRGGVWVVPDELADKFAPEWEKRKAQARKEREKQDGRRAAADVDDTYGVAPSEASGDAIQNQPGPGRGAEPIGNRAYAVDEQTGKQLTREQFEAKQREAAKREEADRAAEREATEQIERDSEGETSSEQDATGDTSEEQDESAEESTTRPRRRRKSQTATTGEESAE